MTEIVTTAGIVGIASMGLSASAHAATVADEGFGFKFNISAGSGVFVDRLVFDEAVPSVSDSVSAPETNPFFPGPRTSDVRGNLATGEVGLTTEAPAGGVSARISLIDTLTFDLKSLALGTNVDVNLITSVNGSFISGAQPNFSFTASSSATTGSGALLADVLSAGAGYRGGGSGVEYTVTTAPTFSRFRHVGNWNTFGRSVFEGDLTLFGGLVNEVDILIGLPGGTSHASAIPRRSG